MRLIYIWVKEFKCLRNAEFNFSDGLRFTYNCDTSILKKIEGIETTNLFPVQETPSVDNISIIVGSNGSGKTSICELLFEQFYLSNSGRPFLMIWEINGEYIKYKSSDIHVNNQTGIDIRDYFHTDNFDLIYYSPFYSPMHVMSSLGSPDNSNFHDISTSAMLKNDLLYYKNERSGIEYSSEIKETTANTVFDFQRIISFLVYSLENAENFRLGITLPISYYFELDDNDIYAFEKEFKNNENLLQIYYSLKQKISVSENNKFVYKIFLAIFCNFARSTLQESFDSLKQKVANEYFARIESAFNESENNVELIFREIFNSLNSDITLTGFQYSLPKNRTTAILKMMNFILALPMSNIGEGYISFKLDSDTYKLKEFQRLYEETKELTEYGKFSPYPYVSSGEYAELLFYSRLYEQINKIVKKDFQKNIILFIDELEVTLHPKLQQRIVQNILYFIQDFFGDSDLHFQIIFSTHSPILLSDIPNSNVIYLKKEIGSKYTEVLNHTDEYQTFGSNIYNLYKNQFFMDETLMGEFSKNIINKAIDEVNDKYNTRESVSDYTKYVISRIGEPIIKKLIEERMR